MILDALAVAVTFLPQPAVGIRIVLRQLRELGIQPLHGLAEPGDGSVQAHDGLGHRGEQAQKGHQHRNNGPFAHASTSLL